MPSLSDSSSLDSQQGSLSYRRFEYPLLALIAAVAILLRVYLLTKRDLWVDEALSVVLAQSPWRQFWSALWNAQANMGFYYLLMRGWIYLGDSEAVVRGLSVLFGVAVIPATYELGRRLFGGGVGLVAAALSAVNIFQIRYSQETRAYSLLILLAVLSTYFFLRAVDSPNAKRYWVGYVGVNVLGVYTHVFICLVVAAHWFSLGYKRMRLIPRRAIFTAAAAFILLSMPMALFTLLKPQGRPEWIPRPSLQELRDFATFFTGNGGVFLFLMYAILCLAGLLLSRRPATHEVAILGEQWRVKLVVWWLVFPIASTLLVSFFLRPIFYDRFMAVSAAALVLLAGKGMLELDRVFHRSRVLFAASLIVMLGLSLAGIYRFNMRSASLGDDWRLATQHILTEQQPGDAVFFYRASCNWPFRYYAGREMEQRKVLVSPTIVFPSDWMDPNQTPSKEQTSLAIRGRKRIWLVLEHEQQNQVRKSTAESIRSTLLQDFYLLQERVFPGTSGPITVSLYARTPGLVNQIRP